MPVIRASDIGTFLYCNRAWWYLRQGIKPENQAALTSGIQFHRLHGRGVLAAYLTRIAGYVLFIIAVALLIYSAVTAFF